ncbi:MAG: LuxR C-terminal-related transcriptional regulator [Actinomycetota bacterium]
MAESATPPLIESRFHLPAPHLDDIERADVLACLPGTGSGARLTLIVSPPGWGKSTLLSQWGSHVDSPYAYLAFDERDADARRALTYLTVALRRAVPGLEETLLVEASPSIWIDESLPLVVERLASADEPVTIVLDDYHFVSDPGLHAAIAALVEHLPAGCHVMLASREQPPFPTARLRVARQLTEIGPTELALDVDETGEVLSSAFALQLADDDLVALHRRTEGWPAAITLAGISLSSESDASTFIRELRGSDRLIDEYLADEVIHRLSPEVRSFVAALSVLPRFCASLADAVVEHDDSATLISELRRQNLFLVALDARGEWFRFHHLFHDHLRGELPTDTARELHRRAADWWLADGRFPEAIDHLLAGGFSGRAGDVVAEVAWAECVRGRSTTVRRWIDALDHDALVAHPELYAIAAQCADDDGDLDIAQEWLDRVDHEMPALEPAVQRAIDCIQMWQCTQRGEGKRAAELAERLVESMHDMTEDEFTSAHPGLDRAEMSLNAVAAFLSPKDLDRAIDVLEQLIGAPDAVARNRRAASAAAGLASVGYWTHGDIEQHRRWAARSTELAGGAQTFDSPYFVGPLLALVLADPVGVDPQLVERMSAFSERLTSPYPLAMVRLAELFRSEALGDTDDAIDALNDAKDLLASTRQNSFMEALLAAAAERLSGVSPRIEPNPAALTDREIQILRTLGGNLTQREIARELYLSFNTVKSYSRTAFRKLGVHSRKEAVARCRELGIF